ncbi:unnamed protein product [Sympodiomycopsis kandeliae]
MMALFSSNNLHVASCDREADSCVIEGSWNEQWRLGQSLLGGYPVVLNVQAAQLWARESLSRAYVKDGEEVQLDPLHVNTTFINATTTKLPFRILVQVLKRGRSLSHMEVSLCQPSNKTGNYTPALISHIMLTSFASRKSEPVHLKALTLAPSNPLYYSCPLSPPPHSDTPASRNYKGKRFGFSDRISVWPDERFNQASLETHGKGLAYGAWLQFTGKEEEARSQEAPQWIPVASDLFWNPSLIMRFQVDRPLWFPTLTLAIEYKRPPPRNPDIKRWGHISRTKVLESGHYENDTEIFSHPEDNHLLDPPMKESDGPQLLAISRQLGMTVDMAKQMGGSQTKEAPIAQKGGAQSKL